ncbi:MAG: alpha/beta hydrolase-fold protein [Actinomycetaceae bacterium]|nr:alpha/beta hydrolase-fold protein [Actinomycetaceae bacterium]
MPNWLQPVSLVTIVVFGIIAAITLIWTLFWVPRHRPRKTVVAILQQLISVTLSIVLSMIVLGLILNKENYWYPTWASLGGGGKVIKEETVGAPSTQQGPTASTDDPDNAPDKPQQDPKEWATGKASDVQARPQSNPALGNQKWEDTVTGSGGHYLSVTIPGPAAGANYPALIWLPPSYLDNPDRFYPVVFAIHGIPGDPLNWAKALDTGKLFNTLSGEKKMREAVMVAPNVFPQNEETECVDAKDGHVKIDTYVSKDVVNWVKTNLRVVNGPQGWATMGISAGGWCASMFSMKHPDVFGSSINMSGYFKPVFGKKPILPADDTTYDLGRVAAEQAPPVKLFFFNAQDDLMPMSSWRSFQTKVKAPTSLTSVIVEHGGHSWKLWQENAPMAYEWLGKNDPAFSWVAAQ